MLLSMGDFEHFQTYLSLQSTISIVILLSLFYLLGLYKNKKWALYVFLAIPSFMLAIFLSERLHQNGAIVVADGMVISGFVLVLFLVLRVIVMTKSDRIFD